MEKFTQKEISCFFLLMPDVISSTVLLQTAVMDKCTNEKTQVVTNHTSTPISSHRVDSDLTYLKV